MRKRRSVEKVFSTKGRMKFTKMHGCGNDYVYVNLFSEQITDPAEVSKKVSLWHFGIGSDGLITIGPSETADFRMRIYNADGSEAEMCGNGIRCVAKYVYDHGMTEKTEITVETGAGIKTLLLHVKDGKVETVRVDMGEPVLAAELIPVDIDAAHCAECDRNRTSKGAGGVHDASAVIDQPIEVAGREWRMTCVSMGNPHAVVFVPSVQDFPLTEIGPLFENHEVFPRRINTEFVELIDRHEIRMRVWERGSGETMACGTGACASVMAAILNGRTEDAVKVHLTGGDLLIEYDRKTNHIFMTGPAETVFEGEIEI